MTRHIDLTKERFIAHRDNHRDGKVHLLNLIRLREHADYPDGRASTGAEAYRTYGRISEPVLARLGVKIVWEGRFENVLIGPDEESWDLSFVAEYPSLGAFNEILRDPVYSCSSGLSANPPCCSASRDQIRTIHLSIQQTDQSRVWGMTIGTPPSTSAQISQVDVEAHLNLRKGTFAQVKCNSSLIPVRRLPFKLIRTKSSSYSYRLSQ